jgi:predicted Zn finger-like uncharacterized protein|tara:strand:- start:125 stop:634 length:510 start_codon:yes stop_codon:yes gene_type:complete
MILTCNACEKKFVVPDQAIVESGRIVQCGSCGNKWKQYPIKSHSNIVNLSKKKNIKKNPNFTKSPNIKKKKVKKSREISLYSPEYLAKKHGISLNDVNNNNKKPSQKVSFGFYNSLILFIFILVTLSRVLYFFQDFIAQKLPFTEFYLNYFFENIRNIFEIFKSLISNY